MFNMKEQATYLLTGANMNQIQEDAGMAGIIVVIYNHHSCLINEQFRRLLTSILMVISILLLSYIIYCFLH